MTLPEPGERPRCTRADTTYQFPATADARLDSPADAPPRQGVHGSRTNLTQCDVTSPFADAATERRATETGMAEQGRQKRSGRRAAVRQAGCVAGTSTCSAACGVRDTVSADIVAALSSELFCPRGLSSGLLCPRGPGREANPSPGRKRSGCGHLAGVRGLHSRHPRWQPPREAPRPRRRFRQERARGQRRRRAAHTCRWAPCKRV